MKRAFNHGLSLLLITLGVPLLLLLGVEGALRLAGFGQHIPLFVAAPKPDYLMPNPELVKRFVHYGAPAPNVSPDTVYFREAKPPGSIRLAVMGGSTAAGFPYGRFGSPAGLIQQRLQAMYPDHQIEVVSVAMSSVNSYTLRDIAEEVAAITPDAILIYAGHNEYLGIMGTGATSGGHLANLAFLTLKDSRLFQLLQQLLGNARFEETDPNAHTGSGGRTVMAQLAQGRDIAFESQDYYDGIAQFTDNMDAVLSTFSRHAIPVLVSTIAANEKDQRPFKSLPGPDQADTGEGDIATLERLVDAYPASANYHFALATALEKTTPETAHQHYVQAMDRDLLRFRAPSAFNTLISQMARRDGVYLVDSVTALRRDAGTPSLGNTHMLEHLHPNELGYFLIADAFLTKLRDTAILPVSVSPVTAKAAWKNRPLTPVDAQFATLKVSALTSGYPFTTSTTPFTLPPPTSTLEAMAQNRFKGEPWLSQQTRLLALFQRNQQWHHAATVATVLATALPYEAQTSHVASQLALRANRIAEAIYFARQAVRLAPNNILSQLTLAEALFKYDRPDDAADTLRRAQAQFPEDKRPEHYLSLIGARQ